MARRLERAGVGAIVLPVALRGGDPRRGDRAQPLARAGHRALRRGARLLPRRRGVRGRRRPLPAPRSSGSRPQSHGPGHRQPEREQRRRLGPLRAAHRGGRRGRARAEPVPRRRGPAPVRGRDGGAATSSSSRPSARAITIPLAVKLSPVLLGVRQLRRRGRRAPAPTGSSCSIASTSPTSTWIRSRSCRGSS